MQTFLCYTDFVHTSKTLDYRRLGKQRVEAKQILDILLYRTNKKGWQNHPAVLMWKGYEEALKDYYNTIVWEWEFRGYVNNMPFEKVDVYKILTPNWLDDKFCSAHRSNLIRKDPVYYGQFGWTEDGSQEYIWPVKKG